MRYITTEYQIAPDAILFGFDMFITLLKIKAYVISKCLAV